MMGSNKPVFHTARISNARLRTVAYGMSILVGLGVLVLLSAGKADRFHAAGPANPGHEDLDCAQCHRPAPGTLRQQAQAKVRAFFSVRENDVAFANRKVETKDCVACHARDDDRHPVYRFDEPKFKLARKVLGANSCIGCHVEHSGNRTEIEPDACKTCHGELAMREDPLDVPHKELVKKGQWDSCLTCHDFHGNHGYKAPTRLDVGLSPKAVEAYLRAGPSPYGKPVKKALQARKDIIDE